MSYVAIFVARNSISLDEIFPPENGTSWVHGDNGGPDHDRRFVLAGSGELRSEADAADIDWAASKPLLLEYQWRYRFRDRARDIRAEQLYAVVDRCIDRALDAKTKWGREHPRSSAAHARVDTARGALVDFHISYIRSRRTPIALGIYGTT